MITELNENPCRRSSDNDEVIEPTWKQWLVMITFSLAASFFSWKLATLVILGVNHS